MVHVERRGVGAPLLLIHGLGGDWAVWEPVLDRLAEHREVLAVDLPGFGSSPPLPSEVAATPTALAAGVATLLDELGLQRVETAGNSLGAWVALELARAGRTGAVTAIAPAGFWARPLGPRRRRGPRALPHPVRAFAPWAVAVPFVRRVALASVVAHPERVPVRAARRIVRTYLEAPGFDAANAAMRDDRIRLEDVAALDVPVTLAWAELDRLVGPPRGGVAGVRTIVIPGAGHLAMWDQPDLVADLILAPAAARAEPA